MGMRRSRISEKAVNKLGSASDVHTNGAVGRSHHHVRVCFFRSANTSVRNDVFSQPNWIAPSDFAEHATSLDYHP